MLERQYAGFFLATFCCALAALFGCQRTVSDPPAAQQAELGNTGLPEMVSVDRTEEGPTGDDSGPSLAELRLDPGDREIVEVAPGTRPGSTRETTISARSTTNGQEASDSGNHPATKDASISNPICLFDIPATIIPKIRHSPSDRSVTSMYEFPIFPNPKP